ncbi:hypothetical protein QMZ92_04200 [Streptomyces sp. HNM0645]|uniref:hypothetical protein n=1 Tax=Streptomyces sp. HNM0645 TaxID=2782343 RepID=UPI0024B7E56A|nr:hypothetical protein [Streptomyces sp. HNM0645]MDI9883622.1 hypothetical protein [Streptomyces sp. HNM0645]
MDAASAGVLLLCRAGCDVIRPSVSLLREPFLLASAGRGWSVLVPDLQPWPSGAEPVDRVLSGWATALAVATNHPVLALWWDADRAGFALATGFRRPVGYVWLADGTPAGEDEAIHTFAARLGLDPVQDLRALEGLTRLAPDTDARARLLGLTAVLSRAGLTLPEGVAPGAEPGGVRTAARDAAEREEAERGKGRGHTVHALRHRPPGSGIPAVVQIAAGFPLTVWGLARRSAGWTVAGAVLLAHGALAPARDRRPAR